MSHSMNVADRAAAQAYERSRANGSHHALALRIATAVWRTHYPHMTADHAHVVVANAVSARRKRGLGP